jgi:hypothetical protein
MIVFQIDIKHFSIFIEERDSPVAGHPYTPRAFSVASERMKSVARDIHIVKGFGLVEDKQDSLDTTTDARTDATHVTLFVEALQAPVFDALDHDLL